uniref:SpoU rRNA Methylase family protein n=1 Tax=Zea mays TaxID=4577 RepID=B6TZF3_MAIZE|nr:spoU rRNA Methylase family protein [Zea mays]
MLLVRAPPSPAPLSAAANFLADLERPLRLRGLSSSRAGVTTATATAKPAASSLGGQKRKQVTSVANPLVKHCVKLRLSAAYRRSCRRLLLVGLAPILEVCSFELEAIDYLLLLDGVEAPEALREFSGDILYVSAAVMKKVSGMQSVDSTEAVAVMHMPNLFRDLGSHQDGDALDGLFSYPKRILVLDGIQDPGNLGTLIRSACAFKWDGVFLLPACCDPFNEKAIRAARGASLQLPIVSGTWHDLHALVTKYRMKMMAGHPESSSDASKETYSLSNELADSLLNESLCLVLGSEGNGLSAETLQACELVNIPMEGTFESLNVSVAGGIFLFMLQPKGQIDRTSTP